MLKMLFIFLPLLAFAQGEKRIIGLDQRVQLKAHSEAFSRTVGLLERKNSGFCTATLINGTHILTNAHCVVRNTRKFPSSLLDPSVFTFTPGKIDRDGAPFGTFKIKRISVFQHYLNTGTSTHDVAVMELTKPANLGNIGRLRIDENISIDHTPMKITGYSGGKPFGTMWEGSGIILDVDYDRNLLTHDIDTLPGTSGSIMRIRRGRGWVAVGIHRGPTNGDVNNGVFFTPEIFDAINRWSKK